MNRIGLSQFIKNLEQLRNNPMETYKKATFDMIYAVLYQMSKYTIVDTGHARSLIIKKFAEKYGYEYNSLRDQYYNYWSNKELEGRDWGSNPEDTFMFEGLSTKHYKLVLSIKDDGLYNQEIGNRRYPSNYVTDEAGSQRDNSQFKLGHITFVKDLIDSGNYGSLEKLNYDKLINELVIAIEKKLYIKGGGK